MVLARSSQIDDILTSGSFRVMRETTSDFIDSVHRIFKQQAPTPRGWAFLMCGSPRRCEMTPESDVDLIIISPPNENTLRTQFLTDLRKLPYDKIDVPYWSKTEDLANGVCSGSPESGHTDVAFLFGDRSVAASLKKSGILEHFYSTANIQAKIVFNHFFSMWDSRNKSSSRGPNLKYSDGGTRELLFIDEHFVNAVPQQLDQTRGEPRIVSAIRSFLSQGILSEHSAINLANAIDIVVYCKFRTLELLRDTPNKGRGWMNMECASALIKAYKSDFTRFGVLCALDLMLYHARARQIIHNFRNALFRRLIMSLDSDVCSNVAKDVLLGVYAPAAMVPNYKTSTTIEKIGMIWRAAEEQRKNTFHWIVQREKYSKEFQVLASLLTVNALKSTIIDRIAEHQAADPGNEYLNRLIIRHPRTKLDTLHKLMDGRRLAISDDVDQKYRQLLKERCTNGR